MPRAHFMRRIRNRPEDLFGLVAEVENYPEFIDLISALRVTKKLSETEFEAEVIVAYKMISETFRSRVIADRRGLNISVKKAEAGGAIKSLLNSWKFYPLKDGSTLVDVVVDVRLKAMPLEFLLREKFSKASIEIITDFEERASREFSVLGDLNYDCLPEMVSMGLDIEKLI